MSGHRNIVISNLRLWIQIHRPTADATETRYVQVICDTCGRQVYAGYVDIPYGARFEATEMLNLARDHAHPPRGRKP